MSDRQFKLNAKNIDRMTGNGIELKIYSKEDLEHSIKGLTTTFRIF